MSDKKSFPEHVAIILDGNGRWAKERGRERTYGHQVGAANVKTIVRAAGHMGVKVLTLYAFSTENWKRPPIEVRFLMKLFKSYLISQLRELVEDNVQVHIVGEPSALSDDLRKEIAACEKDAAKCDGMILNVAINSADAWKSCRRCSRSRAKSRAALLMRNPSPKKRFLPIFIRRTPKMWIS